MIINMQKEIERLQRIKSCDIQKMIDEEKLNIYKNYIPKDKIRDRLLVVTDLKSEIDLSKKETPVEFYVLDYVNNLLEELLESEE